MTKEEGGSFGRRMGKDETRMRTADKARRRKKKQEPRIRNEEE